MPCGAPAALCALASCMCSTSPRVTSVACLRCVGLRQVRAVDMPMRFPQLHFQQGGSTLETCDVVCSNADPRDLDAIAYALKRGYRYGCGTLSACRA